MYSSLNKNGRTRVFKQLTPSEIEEIGNQIAEKEVKHVDKDNKKKISYLDKYKEIGLNITAALKLENIKNTVNEEQFKLLVFFEKCNIKHRLKKQQQKIQTTINCINKIDDCIEFEEFVLRQLSKIQKREHIYVANS